MTDSFVFVHKLDRFKKKNAEMQASKRISALAWVN